ncbi:MAG: hypothetical protein PHR28_09675, partial [candidate division Zixibacteria bacterium]|nr:hypothetical protein [candidate division Zixibacteria bacterium]
MALIIYGVLIPGVCFASAMVAPLPRGLFLLIVPPLLYAVSILLSLFAAYLIDIYNPRVKDRMRDLLWVPGVRWSCALTAIIIALCLLVDFIWFRVVPSTLALSYLLPILIVSAVNAAGIEVNLKRLAREPAPGKAVIPELPSGPEIAEDIVRDFRWEFKGKPYEVR